MNTAFYLVSQAPALLSAIVLTHLLMLNMLNPVLKFDGYWLLSDLAGIHNLHQRVSAAARKLRRGGQLTRGELALLNGIRHGRARRARGRSRIHGEIK